MQQDPAALDSRRTGRKLIDALSLALQDHERGVPEAAQAGLELTQELERVSMRPDAAGMQARQARDAFNGYFEARTRGEQVPLPQIELGPELADYDLDSGGYENARRWDLLGDDRKPSYQGPDGGWYVDAGGVPTRIPVERYLPFRDALVAAQRGDMPMTGQLVGGMGSLLKAADLAQRAATWAITDYAWDDIPPQVNVPTADPKRPFPLMPQLAGGDTDSSREVYRLLQNPVELRAMQEVIAQAASEGALDMSVWDHVLATSGFLVDFAATSKGLGLIGKGAKALVGGTLAGRTVQAAENVTKLDAAAAGASQSVFGQGFNTIREFMGYQLVNDAIYGRIGSAQDVASSAMTGAKDGAVMVGAGMAMRAARSGVLRALAGGYDPAAGRVVSHLGPLGKAAAGLYYGARGASPVTGRPLSIDELTAKAVALSSSGRGLRETLARQGWTQQAAQMAEHAIDSAGLGIVFGAYHHAVSSEGYEDLHPWEKTKRMVDGLTSPEAIGGAIAFAGQVLAHGYANKFDWGKEWEKAPPLVRKDFDARLSDVMREIAQPSNYESVDAFRRAFDEYRRASPKEWADFQSFEHPYERDVRIAVAEGSAEMLSGAPPREQPPEGPAGAPAERLPQEPLGGPTIAPELERPDTQAEAPAQPPQGLTQAEWAEALAGEILRDPNAALARLGIEVPRAAEPAPAPARQPRRVSGEGPDLMRSIERAAELERIPATDLVLAPEEMQYKSGTDPKTGRDPEGPLSKLKDRGEWSEISAGTILVYERASGEKVVVDGHQRTNAAKRLSKGGEPISLNSFVVRESDGITPQQARALGAVLNTRAGTGKAVDVAKVIRDLGWSPEQVQQLGARGAFAKQAIGLSQLSDPVFSMVVNEQVAANLAAEVGRHIPRADEKRQIAAIEMIRRTAKNAEMAESIARGAATEDLFTGTQTDLFGGSDVKTLLELRTEIVDAMRPGMKRLATAMKSLAKNAGTAQERGVGEIDRDRAKALAEDQGALLSALEMQAGKRGTAVNEILNRHAEQLGKVPGELRTLSESALRELEALAQQGGLFRDAGGGPAQPAQPGGASLFSDPYTRGQQRLGFPEDRRPVERLTPQVEKAWLGKIQDTLFPITEYRNGRVAALVRQLTTTFGIKSAEAEAAVQLMEAHAETWAKSTGKSVEDWYRTRLAGVTNATTPLPPSDTARSAVTFLSDGRAVLHALKQPRVSDVLHELAHVWRRDIEGAPREALEKWAGVRDGAWTVAADEKFASAVERYVRQGKAPTPGLKSTFKQLGEWMRSIYQRIRGTGLDVTMPSDVRKAVESLWALPELAEDFQVRERLAKLSERERGEIYTLNRNKPQYVGMALEEIVGHELRGGLPEPAKVTPAIRIAQAGDSARQAVDVLKWHGALGREIPYEHESAARAVLELARGGDAFRSHFEARGKQDALAVAVESAKRAQVQMRDSVRESMDEKWKARAKAAFEYLDARDSAEPIRPELLREMQQVGLADKKGRLDRLMLAALGRHAEVEMQKRMLEGFREQRLTEPQAAARPWLAFNRNPWEFSETPLARAMSLDRVMDKLREKRWISPELNRRVLKLGAFYGQMWSQNAVGKVGNGTIQSAAMHVFGSREQMVNMLRGRGEDVLAKLAARFGYRAPPASDVKLLNWAVESGAVGKMKGPEDFEKIRKGSGYLFDLAVEINDILGGLGQAAVRAGYLAPEQLEKHGGKYRPHLYLSLQQEDIIKELREGRLPNFAGRNMARGAGTRDGETRLQIEDPFVWLSAVTHQEGKAIQFLGTIQDLLHGGYAISEKVLRELDPYTQGLYEPATLDLQASEASLSNGPARVNAIVMGNMLREQLDLASGRPKSTQLANVLRSYLGLDADMKPSKDGRLFLPRQLLWELNGLALQLFNPPEVETVFQKALYGYEQATRGFRRGLTVGRPKHWTLNIFNSVMTNHVLDRLPAWDVVRSMLTGQGYYADAHRDIRGLLELVEAGNPKEKPESWSHDKWERVQLLQEAFQVLNGTTFTGVGLETSVVTDALSAAVTPDMVTAGLTRDMNALGLAPEHAGAWRTAIFDVSRRMGGGLSEFDRTLHKMGGSQDANERARAMANFTGLYQLWEMSFKWAATLRTMDTQPEGLSLEQAVRYAAAGTADYANTSPLMRSFNTSYSSFSNPLFRKAEGAGGAAGRALMREMLKGRFWMYTSTMTGPLMASVASHPVRAAQAMALMAVVTGALHQLSTKDPEEDAAFQEALRGSIMRAGAPLLDPAAQEAVSRMNLGYPNVTGGVVPDEARGALPRLWSLLMSGKPLIFQAPSRGDETRVSSTEDLAPGWGEWIGAGHSLQNVTAMNGGQIATSLFDAMSIRGMELSLALAHGAFGGLKTLTADGPDAWLQSIKGVRDAASDVLPTISPFFLASRDGQRMVEVAALNGQKIEEFARGIIQVDDPSPALNAGEFLFSTLWRSQRLVQPHMGGVSEREALDAIVGRLFPGASRSDGPFWDTLRSAQADVHYQLSEVLSGAYDSWLRGGRSMSTFDSWLIPQMFGERGAMQQLLEREPNPEKKARMREYFERFVTSDEWSNTAGMAMELARRREMRPEFFRQALTNAMRDPTGQSMLNWLDKEVVRKTPDREAVHDYAAVFFGAVKPPAFGTTRYAQWEQVLKRLYDYGYKPTVQPDNAADALRRLGKKPELSGLPALQSATLQRPRTP